MFFSFFFYISPKIQIIRAFFFLFVYLFIYSYMQRQKKKRERKFWFGSQTSEGTNMFITSVITRSSLLKVLDRRRSAHYWRSRYGVAYFVEKRKKTHWFLKGGTSKTLSWYFNTVWRILVKFWGGKKWNKTEILRRSRSERIFFLEVQRMMIFLSWNCVGKICEGLF